MSTQQLRNLPASLIGFTTGLLITTLLLVLTLRASRFLARRAPASSSRSAACSGVWAARHTGLMAAHQPADSFFMLASPGAAGTGAAAFPSPSLPSGPSHWARGE